MNIGASQTITELIRLFELISAENSDFLYLREASDFLKHLGNKQIRNVSNGFIYLLHSLLGLMIM